MSPINHIFLIVLLVLPLLFSVIMLISAVIAVLTVRRRRRTKEEISPSTNSLPENTVIIPSNTAMPAVNTAAELTEKSFAAILRNHRTSRHISQEYVAQQLDVTRQAVSKWENGTSEPSTANLIALAKLYGISLDELVRGTNSVT